MGLKVKKAKKETTSEAPKAEASEPKKKAPFIVVRAHQEQKDFLARAAHAVGRNVGEYIRFVMLPHAAEVLQEAAPELPEFGGRGTGVAAAAKLLGLSVKEFKKQALENAVKSTITQ